jgi:hypothetical protein
MQKVLLEEGFGFHVNKCLLDMTEEDFQRLNFLLTELKPLLAREHAKAVDTDTLTTPPDEEMIETASGEQLKTIFSKREDGMDFETFKKQAMPSLKKMFDQSRKEGAEKRKKGIAWRMQCLGFPLHTILRVTGYTPATETPGDPKHVWR